MIQKTQTTTLLFSLILTFAFTKLDAQKYTGYTLYSLQNSTSATLLDTAGITAYKTWTGLSSQTGYSSYLLPGGVLLRTAKATGVSFSGGPICGKIQKIDWNGAVLWDFTYSTTDYCTHHDISPMPNGNVLLIAYERRTAAEVQALANTFTTEMWPDKIVEVRQTGPTTGEVVWEWKAWDHLQQNVSTSKKNYYSTLVPERLNINYKTTKDWIHMNGIDYNAELDQIIYSSHSQNEIYIIDHSTTTLQAATSSGGRSGKGGDILFRFGNPIAYGASGLATIDVCHDAHWIDVGPWKNKLAYFNNRGVSATKSSVDFVQAPILANGFTYTGTWPTTYNKRLACNGSTTNMGGSNQFPNGNQIYTLALSGMVYEVDSNDNQLWSKSLGGSCSKVKKYAACEINGGLVASTSTPKFNFCGTASEITLNCSASGGSGTNSYSWTSYPSGFSSTLQNPAATPSTSTTYICEVSNGNCKATQYSVVNIYPKPIISVSKDTTISSGASVKLKAIGGNSYLWNTNANTDTITVSPTSTSIYTVRGFNKAGCMDSAKVIVTVTGGSLSVIASANPNPVCSGDSVQLNALPSGGSGSNTFTWTSNPSGFSSNMQNPKVLTTSNTNYSVSINNSGNNANAQVLVTVNQKPTTPIISQSGNTLNSYSSTGNQWYFSGNKINGANSQVFNPTQSGVYQVQVIDAATNCASQLSADFNFTFLGLEEITNSKSLTIFPNPSNGTLNFEGAFLNSNDFEIFVFDVAGKLISVSKNTKKIDLSFSQNGFYLITVKNENDDRINKKIILNK